MRRRLSAIKQRLKRRARRQQDEENQQEEDLAPVSTPSDGGLVIQLNTSPTLLGGSTTGVLLNLKYTSTLVPRLAASLPNSRCCDDWQLLYSLAQHGCSLHTLLRKVRGHSSTLIVVETTKGEVFGGFVTETWQNSANYYGGGESFVFTLNPQFESFPWSCLNMMVMFSNDECIAMGGGGDFAWCLNADLSRGTSGKSKTFGNRCLTRDADFDIFNVEVWGFVTP